MGCCSGLSRFLLFTFNIACFLIGLALIIIGIVYEVNFIDFTNRLDEISPIFQTIPILLIVVGSIIFVIAFLGCCGAWRRNSCMLTTYGVILIIILVLQVALVIFTFIQVNNSSWEEEVHRVIENLFATSDPAATESIDFIQSTLGCCGVQGPPILNPPNSCCTGGITNPCVPFPDGCASVLYDFFNSGLKIIGIVAASLAAIELICAILAFWIARKRSKSM